VFVDGLDVEVPDEEIEFRYLEAAKCDVDV
jgi:hypothetical protein